MSPSKSDNLKYIVWKKKSDIVINFLTFLFVAITITPVQVAVGAHGVTTETSVTSLPLFPQIIEIPTTGTGSIIKPDLAAGTSIIGDAMSSAYQSLSFEAYNLLSQAQASVDELIVNPDGTVQTIVLQDSSEIAADNTASAPQEDTQKVESDADATANAKPKQVRLQLDIPVTILPDGRLEIGGCKEGEGTLKVEPGKKSVPQPMDTLAQAVMELQDSQSSSEIKTDASSVLDTTDLPITLQIGAGDGSFATVTPTKYRLLPSEGDSSECHCSQGNLSFSETTGTGPVTLVTTQSQPTSTTTITSTSKSSTHATVTKKI